MKTKTLTIMKVKIFIAFLMLLACSFVLKAQNHSPIQKKVMAHDVFFNNAQVVRPLSKLTTVSANQRSTINKAIDIDKAIFLSLDFEKVSEVITKNSDQMSISLPFEDNSSLELNLIKAKIFSDEFNVYAYLQLGEVNKAKNLVDYLKSIKKFNKIGIKAAYPTAAIPARFYLDTRQWDKASKLEMSLEDFPSIKFPWSNGIIHFTRILGAIHSNDIVSAKKDQELLRQCHGYLLNDRNQYMADQVLIMVKAAEAWIKFYEGNNEEALSLMIASAEIELNTDKQSLTPGEVLPAQELLGDLLIELDKPSKALEAYNLNLSIRPNRFNSIYGAAIASKLSGNQEKATMYFEQLLKLVENSNSDRTEIKEASDFLAQKAM